MSEIRVDEITDEAGTGAPDFTNGITVSGSFTSLGIDDNATSTAMTLDTSGNLLVGRTAVISVAGTGQVGADIRPQGTVVSYRDGGISGYFGRNTSDGDILQFRKDGTTVGSIGNSHSATHIGIHSGSSGIGCYSSGIYPIDGSGTASDNNKDLGAASVRWDDVRATNGTIQTSDRNEKQQIASLTTAEMDAAKAISQLFKTFKWNDSVADKGDAARTHSGVIAQDVETAMTDAGLDAGDYAFFISDTWWEDTEDYTDNDGVQQTRTKTYETLAEAPAGATERTRKGIRYPELLSFVGAATEQRLADIETRLTALEAV